MQDKTFAPLKVAPVPALLGQKHSRISSAGEFEPFKMMIGAIFALMVLTIIISAISAFDQWRLTISKDKFFNGLRNAVQQPNGDMFLVENIFFDKGESYSANSIAKIIGLKEGCLEMRAYHSPNTYRFQNNEGNQSLEILTRIETDVFACCTIESLPQSGEGCETKCIVSFAKKLDFCS